MENIIASVLGGLVSGLFTFLGVWLTIRHEELRRQKEKEELLLENRPRFEITEFEDLSQYSDLKKADASLLFCTIKEYKNREFYYDPNVIKPENWVSIEYTLKNIGNTEISYVYFSTELVKSTSLFSTKNENHKIHYMNKFLNYSVILDKAVKPGDSIKLKVSYIKGDIIESCIGSATITIWMVDEKKNWWAQSLFAPYNKIYNSSKTTRKEWNGYTDIETAIRCFDNPMLW